jgi:hypothetical protein
MKFKVILIAFLLVGSINKKILDNRNIMYLFSLYL